VQPLIEIIKYFLDNPYSEVYLRELAKKIHLSPFAVKKYADILVKKAIISEEKKANLRIFKANTGSLFYKHLKIAYNIQKIEDSGLISKLRGIPNVSSLVLFGSTAKGQDDSKSDIDMVVIGKRERINLNSEERKLNKEINLHVYSWSGWKREAKENAAFYYDVVGQGISLYGELPIVK